MKRFLIGAAFAALLPIGVATAGTAKFTFNPVTFSDGTTGVITVSSKTTGNGSRFTTCDYYSADFMTFLGQYEDATFASANPDELKSFCLMHVGDRVQ